MQAPKTDTRHWMAGEWLSGSALAPLNELNLQCLQIVAIGAGEGLGTSGQRAIGRRIASLTDEALGGLAAAPYLLADAGFDDATRWQLAARWRVADVPRDPPQGIFTQPAAATFVRGVLVYAWHLARAHRQLARVVLGMSPACARTIGELNLSDLDWVCANRPGWLSLRWEFRPRLWDSLLTAAQLGDRQALRRASLRGIQQLGALALERRGPEAASGTLSGFP